jgi:hypothetical protein
MRWFARAFGLICGSIVIAIAARYGFKTSDNDFDGYIWAFTYGAVTLGGLFGHALGVHAWRHSKLVGVLVFAGSAFALLISLSNSIGAMAGRGNEQQAERIRIADTVRDARRSLKRTEDEREGLKFTPADEVAVQAAKARAGAATQAKEAECTYRGPRCREKEEAEGRALADLETLTRNKAMTDRAAKLDSDIAGLRERIERAGPVLEANSQGSALARLFGMPEAKAATLSTYQNLAMAMVIEFLIVISLVASEVIEPRGTRIPAAPDPKVARTQEEPSAEPVLEALPAVELPIPFQAPPKPRLVASRVNPAGSVATIMAELIEPGVARDKVEFAEAFKAYATICRQQGKRAVLPEHFAAALKQLCDGSGIRLKNQGQYVFLMRVRLRSIEPASQTLQ